MTLEDAAQPVHHAHLQALPVDKLRHQESLWRENLRSCGNPRTRTPTGHEPKQLAIVSRIEDYHGDPYQLYDARTSLFCTTIASGFPEAFWAYSGRSPHLL